MLVHDWRLAESPNRFAARLLARPFYRNMQITDEGLMLGADIALARQAQNGKEALALEGEGPRILVMLGAAFGDGATPYSLERMQRASELWCEGEKFLAICHLSYARVPPVTTEAQAFALFATDELLKAGMTPGSLMKALGLDPSSFDELAKYNPYHRGPCEGGGQFTTADAVGTGAQSSGGAYSHIPAGTLIGPGQAFPDSSGKPTGGDSSGRAIRQGQGFARWNYYPTLSRAGGLLQELA